MSFALQKLFSFIQCHLFTGDVIACAIDALFRKFSAVPMCSRLFLTFSSVRFSVSGFYLRSFVHFPLGFVHCDRYGPICTLLQVDNDLDDHLLKIFFSIVYLFFLLKNLVSIGLWIYFWAFSSISLINLSVFMSTQ